MTLLVSEIPPELRLTEDSEAVHVIGPEVDGNRAPNDSKALCGALIDWTAWLRSEDDSPICKWCEIEIKRRGWELA